MLIKSAVDRLTLSTPVRDTIESIRSLLNEMNDCIVTLEEYGDTVQIVDPSMLTKIQNRLPRYISSKWVDEVGRIYNRNQIPSLHHFSNFVERFLKSRNNPYGLALQGDG